FALDRAVLTLRHVLPLGDGDEVVDRRPREVVQGPAERLCRRTVGAEHLPIHPGHDDRVREGRHDLRRHPRRVERPGLECRIRRRRRRPHAARRRRAPALTHESYEATMASFIRPRLFSADSVTLCGASPRLTQLLMISRAWI